MTATQLMNHRRLLQSLVSNKNAHMSYFNSIYPTCIAIKYQNYTFISRENLHYMIVASEILFLLVSALYCRSCVCCWGISGLRDFMGCHCSTSQWSVITGHYDMGTIVLREPLFIIRGHPAYVSHKVMFS